MIIGILILVIVVMVVGGSFFVVQQQHEAVIERLGKFKAIVGPGFHVKLPFIDKVVQHVSMRTMSLQSNIESKTKDNVTITMDVSIQYHVDYNMGDGGLNSGTYRAYYMLANPMDQINAYVADALRSAIPSYDLDEVFSEKDAIAEMVNDTVSNRMMEYGFVIVRTLITQIDLPRDVQDAMNAINAARRQQEAANGLAEAERTKIRIKAQGEAEAAEQQGRGVALQRTAIANGIKESLDTIQASGVSADDANLLFMYTQWVDMMTAFAESGNASTVVLPNDFESSTSMFSQMLAADKASTEKPRA